MSEGYQSNTQAGSGSGPIINTEAIISIDSTKQNPLITTTPGRNKLSLVNQNLLLIKDFRMKAVSVPLVLSGNHVLNFPKPLNSLTNEQSGNLVTNLGQKFFYTIDVDGKVYLNGTFNNANDELLLNIHPYITKTPTEYAPAQPS